MATRILACGLTTVDATYSVTQAPGPDQKVVASGVGYDVGGPAANAARTAHALGAEVTLVTALGRSAFADLARERLEGIRLVDVAPGCHELPVSTVLVDALGRRAVVSVNATRLRVTGPAPIGMSDADALLIDGHLMELSIGLASDARRRDVPTVFDGGSYKPGTEDLLAHIDLAAVSADFAFPGGGGTLRQLLDLGASVAIQTHGAGPIEVATAGETFAMEVPSVEVVDTLGAGDVFHGALAVAAARRMNLREAIEFAEETAAQSVQAQGAMGWAQEARLR
ncbi:MAG TPA: PfkB family carbohydrate kinase [Actinomycetaceae bacterium]|nr:PfkB family carbohydrate kinase [Actinomycetaceae bacterium]